MKWKRNNLLKRIIKKFHPFLSWLGGWACFHFVSMCTTDRKIKDHGCRKSTLVSVRKLLSALTTENDCCGNASSTAIACA